MTRLRLESSSSWNSQEADPEPMPCSRTSGSPVPDSLNASAFPPTRTVFEGKAAILASITSVHDVAAVDRQHLSGHEGGVVGEEEQQCAAGVARNLRAL